MDWYAEVSWEGGAQRSHYESWIEDEGISGYLDLETFGGMWRMLVGWADGEGLADGVWKGRRKGSAWRLED